MGEPARDRGQEKGLALVWREESGQSDLRTNRLLRSHHRKLPEAEA